MQLNVCSCTFANTLPDEEVQACHGLAETGIVDEDTWQKLLGQEAQPQVASSGALTMVAVGCLC